MNPVARILKIGESSEIELLEGPGGFKGLGRIAIDGVVVRSSRRPMFVEIRNPSGIELMNYRLSDLKSGPNETVLSFSVDRKDGGIMEWMLHEVRNRYNTADWSLEPSHAFDTNLELVLRPVEHRFNSEIYRGFSYQYRYRSESIPIYKILDRGTWAIDGKISGNTFWLRNGTVDSIFAFGEGDESYSTEWYLPPINQPNIFQFLPLQTQMQGFTLTTHANGRLVTRPTEVSHVRSLFERNPGSLELTHWHEHCDDLSHVFSTSPVEVIFHRSGDNDRVTLHNAWEAIREDTWSLLHAKAGLKQEHVTSYAVVEEWGVPDFDRYTEIALPALLDAGFKTIMLPSEFENNMNTWGVSNMCCQVDLKVSEAVGPEKFAKFCKTARDAGTTVELWGNTALSSLTYIFNMKNGPESRIKFLPHEGSSMEVLGKARSPWVRNPSGAIEADHYTPTFCQMNLRDPVVRDFWNQSWKIVHEDFGVKGIFVDSSFNMTSDKFHWVQNDEFDREGGATIDQTQSLGHTRPLTPPRQAILSQYPAYIQLMRDMQAMGFAVCGEDVGVFGTSRSGPDIEVRMRSLPLWLDSYCVFEAQSVRNAGKEPDDIFFKGLAYRLVWFVYWDAKREVLSFRQSGGHPENDPTPWHLQVLRAFDETSGYVTNRRILADERGVLYDGKNGSALWAFQDFDHSLPEGWLARDILGTSTQSGETLSAKKHHVYLLQPSGDQIKVK